LWTISVDCDARGQLQTNELEEEERASGSASGIYRHIAVESEAAIFGSPLFKRVHEIEKWKAIMFEG
jgi:hypothetical protein